MKHILLLSAFLLLFASSDRTPQDEYIEKWAPTAVSEMERSGVPASITLAQGLLESAAGQSRLAREGNNHFGIKCARDWKGKKIYEDDDAAHECFRVYPSAEASFRDHSDFLRYQNRYKSLFDLDPSDYKAWAKGLKAAGYATDPNYPKKLVKLIEDYGLDRYDRGVDVAVEAPLKIEKPVKVSTKISRYDENVTVSLDRAVYEQNGVRFVYSIAGETYGSIADTFGLFHKEILKFNELAADAALQPGTVVYVQAKKKVAEPGVEKLIIGPDDDLTLRDISQQYAVRLSSIIKMNSLPAGYSPREGDTIKLRK